MQKTTLYFILVLLFILSTSIYAQTNIKTWNGTVSTSFNDGANWSPSGVPNGGANIIITKGQPYALSVPPYLSMNSIILEPGVKFNTADIAIGSGGLFKLKSDPTNKLYSEAIITGEIQLGGNVEIQAGANLTVGKIVTYDQTFITLESNSKIYSSLIISSFQGRLGVTTYKRHVNKIGVSGVKGGNDLISSPVKDVVFNAAFISLNGNIPMNPNNVGQYAFAPYNVTTGVYQNYDIALGTSTSNTENILLVPGKGYRVATLTGSPVTFAGKANIADVTIKITPTGAGKAWNLIGNPYPSYIKADQFLNTNKDKLDINYQSIYGYSSTDGWTVWNSATVIASNLITPGQGFFVKAKAGADSNVEFTKAMRTTGTSDDFIKGREEQKNLALSKLKLSDGTHNRLTSIYFIEGTTRTLDPSYDAASYSGTGSSEGFSIASNLVEDHKGLDMAIQSLPYTDFNDVVVPLNISAYVGTKLTLSIDDLSTLPPNINVYLEDTQSESKVLHLLNDNAYTFLTTSKGSQTGRFNVHYSAKTLSVADLDVSNNLRIYTSQTPKTLFVIGQLKKESKVQLFDIQGRLVLSKILLPNSTENTMDISIINSGIYVVRVVNDHQNKTQKVIIK